MNESILNTDIQDFIVKNIAADPLQILLKNPIFEAVTNRELAEQLAARKKCKKKLPTWFNTPNIYYPNKLNIEQTSSEITAQYKANLTSGKNLLDITGGLGVDSYFFSKKFEAIFHCEIDENLSKIAAYNFDILGAKNIIAIPENGISFLKSQQGLYDWLYIDPSRRNDIKGKVFQLADCLPNLSLHLELFFGKSNNILVKTSPLLDISKGISELKNVYQIHIIAINNEVKELLWVLKKGFCAAIEVKTINFQKTFEQKFHFSLLSEKSNTAVFTSPSTYLYEPNSAVMKSGGFNTIAKEYELNKLHPNTHLYTSKELVDFPGRCFKIVTVYPYNSKAIKKLGISKANITIRNFPYTVAHLRKKLRIKDGGQEYLFFTTDFKENLLVLRCSKR